MAARSLLALLSMTFLYMLGKTMVSPVSPTYFQLVHLNIFGIGVLLGAFGFAFLVSEAAWGFASSRVWSRKTLFVLILVSGLLPIPMSQPQSFAVLLSIQVASGFTLGGVGMLGRLLVPKLAEPNARAKSFGYLGLVFAFGTMVGSLVGGVVYGAVGLSSSFIVAGLVCMSSVVPVWFLQFGGASRPDGSIQDAETDARQPAPLLSLPELIALGVVGMATAASSVFYTLLLPNIITREPSFSANVFEVSLVIALFSFSSGAFQPVMGLRGSRNPRRWITLALLICGLTFTIFLFPRNIPEVYSLSFLAGITSATITPLALSVLSGGVVPSRLGKVFGLYGAAEDAGIIVSALAGGFIWADFGATSVFLAMAALLFAAGMVYVLASSSSKTLPTPSDLKDRR